MCAILYALYDEISLLPEDDNESTATDDALFDYLDEAIRIIQHNVS